MISRAGFSSGNALTFIISGTGKRVADSYDGSATTAHLLTIDYGSTTSNFIAQVYTADLSTGASLTSASTLSMNFTTSGDTIDSLNFGYTGEGVGCFAVADGGDILYQINRYSNLDSIIAGVAVANIEAMTFDRSRVDIIGANANRLGTIDKVTGGFTNSANTFGTGGGAGNINFSDVDAIGMDATLDTLFGVYQTRLFVINSSTGAHVPNYFGTNIDYITITGTGGNIDDIAIDPTTGTLYATQATTLYTINTSTGAATSVGAMGVSDMEGMTFSEAGALYGTTGTGAGASSNSFFSINKSTGAATLRTAFSGNGTDFESCECLSGSTYGGILPVHLVRFGAIAHDDHIDLSWSAFDDAAGQYFVQKLNEENVFEDIIEIEIETKASLNDYNAKDLNAKPGTKYYRLKKVDQQAKVEYSHVKAARIIEAIDEAVLVEIFPNPSEGQFNLNRKIDYNIIDVNRRLVLSGNGDQIDMSDQEKGVYFLESASESLHKVLILK